MIGIVIVLAVAASGALGAILRLRAGRSERASADRAMDAPESGVHAGFSNYF